MMNEEKAKALILSTIGSKRTFGYGDVVQILPNEGTDFIDKILGQLLLANRIESVGLASYKIREAPGRKIEFQWLKDKPYNDEE